MADAARFVAASPRGELPRAPAVTHAGYGYALWLLPPSGSDAEARLRAAQRLLSPFLPRHHPPHVTMLCHVRSLQQARAVAAAVAAATPPFRLTVAPRVQACSVRYSAPRGDRIDAAEAAAVECHAVHAAVSGIGFEAACRAAHAAAVTWHLAAGEPEAEPPAAFRAHEAHVSLAYRYAADDYAADEVAAMDAAAAGAAACCFEADRIAVASAHGLWPEWRVIEELPMRGADWAAAPAENAAPPGVDEDATAA